MRRQIECSVTFSAYVAYESCLQQTSLTVYDVASYDCDSPSPTWGGAGITDGGGPPRLAASVRPFAQQDRSFNPQIFHVGAGPRRVHHRRVGGAAAPQSVRARPRRSTTRATNSRFSTTTPSAGKTTSSPRQSLAERARGRSVGGVRPLQSLPDRHLVADDAVSERPELRRSESAAGRHAHLAPPSAFALGDPRLHLKARIYGKEQGAQVALSTGWASRSAATSASAARSTSAASPASRAARSAGRTPFWRIGAVRRLLLARARLAVLLDHRRPAAHLRRRRRRRRRW